MKQIRLYGTNDLRLDDVPEPTAGPSDIVLSVAIAGICGTDLGFLHQGYIGRPGGTVLPLGHELVGTIESVGINVRKLKPGQRVVVHPMKGRNYIGTGDVHHGGFADRVLVRDASLNDTVFPISDTLDIRRAVLTEPLAVGIHGLNLAKATASDKVVVLGAGPIGLGVVASLKYRGVRDIAVIDVVDERLERARALGATTTVNTGHQKPFATISENFGTRKSKIYREVTADTSLVVDCAGYGPLLKEVIELSADDTRLVILATYKQEFSIDLATLMAKQLQLIGSISYPTEFAEALAMLEDPDFYIDPLISHCYPISQFAEAFEMAQNARQSAKVLLEVQP